MRRLLHFLLSIITVRASARFHIRQIPIPHNPFNENFAPRGPLMFIKHARNVPRETKAKRLSFNMCREIPINNFRRYRERQSLALPAVNCDEKEHNCLRSLMNKEEEEERKSHRGENHSPSVSNLPCQMH